MNTYNHMKTMLITFFTILLIPTYVLAFYIPNDTTYVWSDNTILTSSTSQEDKDFLELNCESAILIEQKTGKILYEKNLHEKLRPASVTKVMTILLIMDAIRSGQIDYSSTITCSENAASMGGSQIWLEVR